MFQDLSAESSANDLVVKLEGRVAESLVTALDAVLVVE